MSTVKAINLQHPSSANPNIVLDNGGNVGIGTSSPNTSILVTGSSSSHSSPSITSVPAIHVFNSNTSSNTAHAIIGVRTNTANGGNPFMSFDIGGVFGYSVGIDNADSDKFKIQTGWNGFGGVGIQLDTSGRVTMPSQPFFMGYPTTDYSAGSMPTQVMAVTASFNNGNHFNSSTNRFTCPVTGWYRVTWGGLQLASTVTSLQVNGSDVHNGNHHIVSGGAYINMTQTVLRYQSAGDYFSIRQWNGGGYFAGWYLWSVELVG
jgi:hypothetical protein